MDLWWALVPVAYALGTFPTAVLVGRHRGHDPTREGSGNPGATNTLRTMGPRAGLTVLLGDAGKGVLAAGGGWALGGRGIGVACGLAAVVGHVAPVTRGFRGGKGVATGAGIALVLLPMQAGILGAVFAIVARLTRAASAGSIAVATGLPIGAALAGRPSTEVAAFAACAALVLARHRGNIERLRRGAEATIDAGPAPKVDAS